MLVLAGCAGTTGPSADPAATGATATAVNSITADGSATVSASPDLAEITVAVEATADNASAARSQVAADVERLRGALTDAGYEVRTVDFRLSPEYDHRSDERELVGYRAYHALAFETEPDDAGSAVDLAVDNGATAVQDVRFTLSDERRAELREEALAAAVTDARSTAETAAGAADRSVGTELSMRVGSAGVSPYDSRVVYETAADAGASTSFDPGPVTVSASVTVTYELE
ncbi:SIMPL domain-containing protein [Halobaculum magnesiiphilum]|uniref:SIMPL domain-containing protein n=2 Tax=Halobaculum magnesiiphilum TaxID=1017351 RepID=A0A8T8WGV3_9EURY|nr:SIMPL domain-containing protein [Halobaculum magnesiiphilum]